MIGNKLRQARILIKCSEEEIAKKLNMTIADYVEYENNLRKMTIGTLFDICITLNWNIMYFLEDKIKNSKNFGDIQ